MNNKDRKSSNSLKSAKATGSGNGRTGSLREAASRRRIIQLAYGQMGPSALKALVKEFSVKAIVTPSPELGLYRSQKTLPVETLAEHYGVPVVQDDSFLGLEKTIKKYKPDAVVIASYNKIIPDNILKLSHFINIHHGDLPRWRGSANVNWAIMLGKKSIVVTIHRAIPNLDAGPIYAKFTIPISGQDTVKTVYDKLNRKLELNVAQIVTKVLHGYPGVPQRGEPSYCLIRMPEDGLINWTKTTREIDRFIRALTKPYPGAFTYLDDRRLTIWEAKIPRESRHYVARIPGRVALIHKDGVEVLTGDGSILLTRVEYQGREGNARDFIKSIRTTLGINWVKWYEKLSK